MPTKGNPKRSTANQSTLVVLRAMHVFHGELMYRSNPDAWVFGDVRGFQKFAATLLKATAAVRPLALEPPREIDWAMPVLVCPALQSPRIPRMRIFERVYVARNKLRMQLILAGNVAAYKALSALLHDLVAREGNGPSDHIHVDPDSFPGLLHPSVYLNLRGPVGHWDQASLGCYSGVVYGEQPYRFPGDERALMDFAYPTVTPKVTKDFWLE